MARLRPLTRDELADDQARLWDAITESRAGNTPPLIGEHGGLIGPFDAFVRVPAIGRHLSALGAQLRFGTSIERRLTEIAICTVGAHWRAEFEFWAHAPMAVEHGVDPALIDALRAGRSPELARDDERVVHAVADQLLTARRVDDATYAAALALLGEDGMVELAALVGYYCLISFLLNLFDVDLPPGEEPAWPDRP